MTKQEDDDRARGKGVVNRAGGRSQSVSDDDRSGDDHRVSDDDRGGRVGWGRSQSVGDDDRAGG